MKLFATLILFFICQYSNAQLNYNRSDIIKIEVWKDSLIDNTDSIRLIQFILPDTTISIKLIDARSIVKFNKLARKEHELYIVVGNDSMNFSFPDNFENYISRSSSVTVWTINIFSDMQYAKRFYAGTSISDEIDNYKKLYSFTCDWCNGEYFNYIK
jgi:hypothetical protein